MTPLDRVREAVRTYRAQPLYSDAELDAAAVAADACEEAGLSVDAAWYRFAASEEKGERPDDEPARVWATDPDRLDDIIATLKRSEAK